MKKIIAFFELKICAAILLSSVSHVWAMGLEGVPCSGALKGSYFYEFPCTLTASFDADKNQATVRFNGVQLPEQLKQVKLATLVQGELEVRDYNSQSLENYMDSILLFPMEVFVASKGAYPSQHVLSIKSVTPNLISDRIAEYSVHGSYDADLIGVNPKGAPLQVHIEF